jgi:hypothetical protein
MVDLDNLTQSQKIVLNACLIGGITFFSTMTATGGLPTITTLWAGFVAMMLALLTQLLTLTKDDQAPKRPRPPSSLLMLF